MVDLSEFEELTREDIQWVEDHLVPNVEAGAEMLDANMPGWAKIINTRLLDLSASSASAATGKGCVLCQIDNYIEKDALPQTRLNSADFGHFTDAWDKIREYEWVRTAGLTAGDLGFDCYNSGGATSSSFLPSNVDLIEYEILDVLWTAENEKRQKTKMV